jgi:hypothetical protein
MKRTLFALTCLLALAGTAFSQTQGAYIILDGKGANIDSVLSDLLLDVDLYQGKFITLQNVIYLKFGVNSRKTTFYECAPWFDESETYEFLVTDLMYNKRMSFYFQPTKTDRDMRKAMMDLDGRFYLRPQAMTISGRFFEHRLRTGLVLYLFLVDSFEIVGKKYTGTIPDKVTAK